MNYSLGIPGAVIWATHIILGLYFIYLGYILSSQKMRTHSLVLFALGVSMASYHSHLWFLHLKGEETHEHE